MPLDETIFEDDPNHIPDHEAMATFYNMFDHVATPSDDQIWKFNSGSGLYELEPDVSGGGGAEYEFTPIRYIRTNGSNAENGMSWANAWATIPYAVSQRPTNTKFWLGPGRHDVTSQMAHGDGMHFEGVGPMSDRALYGNATVIENTGATIESYFKPSVDPNQYFASYENIHFDINGVSDSAIFGDAANHIRVEGCKASRGQTFTGWSAGKFLVHIGIDTPPGDDYSWWRIHDNFTIGCGVVEANLPGSNWLNHILVSENIGWSGTPATNPYIDLRAIGAGGTRGTVRNNSLENDAAGNALGMIHIEDLSYMYIYANGYESVNSGVAISLRRTVCSVIHHSRGVFATDGDVYEWDEVSSGYDAVPAGFTQSSDMGSGHTTSGNMFIIAPRTARL